MKQLIALALITVGLGLSARAQEVVYDPVMNIEQSLMKPKTSRNTSP